MCVGGDSRAASCDMWGDFVRISTASSGASVSLLRNGWFILPLLLRLLLPRGCAFSRGSLLLSSVPQMPEIKFSAHLSDVETRTRGDTPKYD